MVLLWIHVDPHPILTGESKTLTNYDHRIFLIHLAIAYHADHRFNIQKQSGMQKLQDVKVEFSFFSFE